MLPSWNPTMVQGTALPSGVNTVIMPNLVPITPTPASTPMATTPRQADDDADATTHCDATRAWRSAPHRAVAFNPWNAGNATEVALVEEADDFCSDRVVKLAVTAEIDAAAAIRKLAMRRSSETGIALWR
jgi:hypothetical protein